MWCTCTSVGNNAPNDSSCIDNNDFNSAGIGSTVEDVDEL